MKTVAGKLMGGLLVMASTAWAVTSPDPGTRYLVFMSEFSPNQTETKNREAIQAVAKPFPAYGENGRVKVAIGAIFYYFNGRLDQHEAGLRQLLKLSEELQVPVMIKLDGEQWWQARPDLWNWWDPTKPGYNPENRKNVEWTWWSPDHALKIAWRNWGRQVRVLPPPNLMSPPYRQACHEVMGRLIPIISDWYKQLPADQKDLLAGVTVGWESGMGINSYYYPNGNDYLDQPAEKDPFWHMAKDDVLSRGMTQIGYAAVSTAGIRSKGDITEEDLYEVTRRHLEDLARTAAELGLPRERLFTHGWGNPESPKGERLHAAPLNRWACPGWSSYSTQPVTKNMGMLQNAENSDAPHWAVAEWLLMKPVDNYDEWRKAYEQILALPGCRMLCVFSWRNLVKNEQLTKAAEAARDYVRASVSSAAGTMPAKEK